MKYNPTEISLASGKVINAMIIDKPKNLPKSARIYHCDLIEHNAIFTQEVSIWITYTQKGVKYYATFKDF